jgi:hypothetical protein
MDLRNEPWYVGNMERDEADAYLKNNPPQPFLGKIEERRKEKKKVFLSLFAFQCVTRRTVFAFRCDKRTAR